MPVVAQYKDVFLDYLQEKKQDKEPTNLYEPINYILELGGKRLRPVLTLLTADIFGNASKKALDAALAVEMFHNFSLVHDDIMDDAPLRRGHVTVHEKWDINTGILSGDAMLILAYQLFENYEPLVFKQLASLFSKTAIEVCEGQQYDVDFEERNDVTEAEYLKMIEYKTAVLVGAAMQMGAIIAEASKEDQQAIYDFGRLLGTAFQLQDDYLDTFGNPETFGKQVGGDIIENKKTFLYLKALDHANDTQKATLLDLYNSTSTNNGEKVSTVTRIFEESGAAKLTQDAIALYTEKAFKALDAVNIEQDKKEILIALGNGLMKRTV